MKQANKNGESDSNESNPQSRAWMLPFLLTVLFSTSLTLGLWAQECSSVAVEAGYHDYNYGTVVNEELTAEKPESKLWYNDGSWWGVLWVPSSSRYRIYRFDEENECFANVGPDVDDRINARADVLWDGQFLYISSHTKGSGSSDDSARLLRYSYDTESRSYNLDNSFPVVIHQDETEASTIAKDSSGQLWAAWTVDGDVMVNRTLGDDFTWGTPFVLPVQGSRASSDDLAGIIAFAPDRIGIMWSDQNENKIKFAVHRDSEPDLEWEPEEDALHDESLGSVADDHLNLACKRSMGELIAITKSSISDPAVFLLKRNQNGVWTNTSFGDEDYTRPIVLMNTENDSIYAISKAKTTPVKVYYKTTHLSNPIFDPGIGNVLIEHATSIKINNPTSTKQPVNSSTGLLVLASDKYTRDYYHRFLDLSGTASNDATEFGLLVSIEGNGSVSPAGGGFIDGTHVQLTAIPAPGWIFSEWQGDADGGDNPTVVTMNSDKDITARFIEDEVLPHPPLSASISDGQVAGRFQGLATSMMQEIPIPEVFSIMDWRMVNALYGMLRVYQYTDENDYLDYILRWANAHMNSAGDLDEPITDTFTGGLLLELFKITGDDRFLQAGIETKDYMESELQRLGNGTFVHTSIDQVWVDTLFGLIRFLIPLAEALDDPFYLDEAADQIILHAGILQDIDTGLFYHGWDEDGSAAWANHNTHLSPEFWARGNGWVIASLVDLLEKLPASHPRRNELIQILEALSRGLANTQDQTTGLWYTVLTRPGDDGNYLETSGSSLFVYGLSKAIKLGLISDDFQANVNLGYNGLDNLSYDEGGGVHYVILVSAGTNVGDLGYYYGRPVGTGYDYVYGHGVYLEALYVRLSEGASAVHATVNTETIGLGDVHLDPSGGSYEVGTVLTVLARPEPGWQFDGWLGEMNGLGNPAFLTVDEGKTVTARFIENGPEGIHLFNPIADAYVKEGSSSNYGEESLLRNKTSSSVYQSYLKFVVSGVTGTVQQATLRLYVEDPGDGGFMALYLVSNDYRDSSGPWLETEITDSNSPQTGDILTTSTPLVAGSWTEFDVTEAVKGNGDFSFCLNTPLSNSVYLSSKEGTHPPELVIEIGSGFGATKYPLTTSVQGNGSVDPSGGSYDEGTEVTVIAQPVSGWQFVEWQGDASGTKAQTTVTMDDSKSVTAVFSEIPATQYTLSASVQGTGSVDPSEGSYNEGAEVTLTAVPASGWQFVEWQGDARGSSAQTTVTMDGNKSVMAVFAISTPSSNIVLNPAEDSHVKEGSVKNYGDEAELRSKTSSSVYRSYLKFAISDLTGPIETVTLRLFVNDGGDGGPVTVHSSSNYYQGTDNPWLEEGIESSNAPQLDGSPIRTVNSISADSWVEIDVTPAVNGPGDVSFGLINPSSGSVYFSSKEGVNPPELVIRTGIGGATNQYILSTTVQGNGIVEPLGGSYDEGTEVTLTAHPASGWQFVEWQGDASGTNAQTTITMGANKNVTAIFDELQWGAMEIVINTDDEYELWVNGHLVGGNNRWDIAQTYTVPLQSAENVLAVHGVNTGFPGALIAEVRVNDQVVLITDENWRRSGSPESGWQQNGFDDSGWLAAVSHGQYGTEPWSTGIANFPTNSNAHWIWGEVLHEDYREWYFRGSFTQILAKADLARDLETQEEKSEEVEIPEAFGLSQNHPNPFNPSTTLRYQLTEPGHVRLAVYNLTGRLISLLIDDNQEAGFHTRVWQAEDGSGRPFPSGIYLCRLQFGDWVKTIKMTLIR